MQLITFTTLLLSSLPLLNAAVLPRASTKETYDQDTAGLRAIGMCRSYTNPSLRASLNLLTCDTACPGAESVSCRGSSGRQELQPDYNGELYALGKCECNNPIVGAVTDILMIAIPIIGDVNCKVFIEGINVAVDLGLAAVPAGRVVSAAAQTAIKGAKLLNKAGSAGDKWLTPCSGTIKDLKYDASEAFAVLNAMEDPEVEEPAVKEMTTATGRVFADDGPAPVWG